MKRYIWQILLCAILAALLFSCSSSLKSGKTYVVEEVKGTGYVIKFYGLDELFTVNVKHKVGDTVKVFRTFKEDKATIY